MSKVKIFDSINNNTIELILRDFSRNKQYSIDFSMISKHALSRIYEKYVSVLRIRDYNQETLFSVVPEEVSEKFYGEVYTPQYIASFFAKVLSKELGTKNFLSAKVIDPACGSGIFLRTIAERKIDEYVIHNKKIPDSIVLSQIFSSIYGIDIDQNAKKATQLSLALLNLVFEEKLETKSKLFASEALEFMENSPEYYENFDVVVANPPFIAYETLSRTLRERVIDYLGDLSAGKVDSYLAFVYMTVRLLRENGYGALVLPKNFLVADNAKRIRHLLSQSCTLKYLIDLSNIQVFEETGAYVILLVFQKGKHANQSCLVVKCQDMPGRALQDTLENTEVENTYYSIYKSDQSLFKQSTWEIASKSSVTTKAYLSKKFLPLSNYLETKVGIITGDDSVFIRKIEDVPREELKIYNPLIRDREMLKYDILQDASFCAFYPYIEGRRVTEAQMIELFPKTWKYLQKNKAHLMSKKSFAKAGENWWLPMRTRQPKDILIPKIISPHLIISPKFGLDEKGGFLITRSPYFIPIRGNLFSGFGDEIIKYFAAILNSSVFNWYLSSISHQYARGYLLLEPKTLREIPVPDPFKVNILTLNEIIFLVNSRLSKEDNHFEIENQIDDLVSEIYEINYLKNMKNKRYDA